VNPHWDCTGIADPDPGYIVLTLDPGSVIDFFWIPDLGSGSQTHIFDGLMTILGKKFYNLSVLAKKILFLLKNKIIYNFMISVATKNGTRG
jgi:hypothetical protein